MLFIDGYGLVFYFRVNQNSMLSKLMRILKQYEETKFNFVKDKVAQKLQSWKTNLLSSAGSDVLLKSIAMDFQFTQWLVSGSQKACVNWWTHRWPVFGGEVKFWKNDAICELEEAYSTKVLRWFRFQGFLPSKHSLIGKAISEDHQCSKPTGKQSSEE